jgi:hypothetical protein
MQPTFRLPTMKRTTRADSERNVAVRNAMPDWQHEADSLWDGLQRLPALQARLAHCSRERLGPRIRR